MHLKMIAFLNEIGEDLRKDGLSVYFRTVPVLDLQIVVLTGGLTMFSMTATFEILYERQHGIEAYPQAFQWVLNVSCRTSIRIFTKALKLKISNILKSQFLAYLKTRGNMVPIKSTDIAATLKPLTKLSIERCRLFARLCELYESNKKQSLDL